MTIHTPKANDCPDDSQWYLLVEYPLSVFLLDRNRRDDCMAGILFQSLSKLGVPPECGADIRMMLAEFADEVGEHTKQGRWNLPGWVRVFCQRKMIDGEQLGHTEQAAKIAPEILGLGMKIKGGLGFFLIEKGGTASPGFQEDPENLVDVYLYREGE
jgi:hypothetical protein